MALGSTWSYRGWKIRYDLLEPQDNTKDDIKTVVFVHGTPWSSAVFRLVAKSLLASRRYRVLLYDLPGYGESQEYDGDVKDSNFAGDTSVRFQATVLAELLKELEIAMPSVIAHDIAGTIALRALLVHGSEFESLLLLDTNAVLPWGDGFYKLARSAPETFLKLPPNIFEGMLRAVIRSAVHNPGRLASGWEEALAGPWIDVRHDGIGQAQDRLRSFVRQVAQANDNDVAEMLDQNMYARVRCPVKIIYGEADQWIPREKMEKLAGLLTHCLREFVVIPEAGHLVMVDQPERVAWEIFDWLAKM